jgi:Domain of unknown function (DUF4375)
MTDDAFDALWSNLVERSHRTGGIPLTEDERHFYAVNLLRGSVPRSGFIGYFENWKTSGILAAHTGLRALNLDAARTLLEKAQEVALDGRPLPKDATSLTIVSHTLSEEEYERESDRIEAALSPFEDAFCELDDEIWAALCEFAARHELKPKKGEQGADGNPH